MKEHTRNLTVGLTVIVALAMLGGMILLFAGLPEVFQPGRRVRMSFSETGGVSEGDWVHLAGMKVGKVTNIAFADGDPRKGVILTARIDPGVKVPANAQPRIASGGFGRPMVVLVPGGLKEVAPGSADEQGFLRQTWEQPLPGVLAGGGLNLQPLAEAAKGLSKLADTLNSVLAPEPPATGPSTAATRPSAPPVTFRATLVKLDKALDGLAQVLGDPDNQKNIGESLANLAAATKGAKEVMAGLKGFGEEASKTAVEIRQTMTDAQGTIAEFSKAGTQFTTLAGSADRSVQDLSKKLIQTSEELSKLLTSMNRFVTKLESGEGTAGLLVNDPKLYQGLLESSQQLTGLLKDFRELVDYWKKHGLPIKLAK